MNSGFSFSSDTGDLSRKDLDETSKIAEGYFGTKKDSNQIPTNKETREWVFEHLRSYVNIIKLDNKIIGFAFILPTTKELMGLFILRKITERELFERIKQEKIQKFPEAIYLCSSVIKKEFRGKGLATQASIKLINNILIGSDKKPTLFYDAYSQEGGSLAKKTASLTGLTLKSRKE